MRQPPQTNLTITMTAEHEDITPEQAEKEYGYHEGFAKAVRGVMARAQAPWGWCTIKVTAKIGEFEANAYLGGCSYEGPEDFITSDCVDANGKSVGGYFDDMVKDAIKELKDKLR